MVEGGNSRQQSVENALAALDPDTTLVAVHDAVRPFIDLETIEKVIDEAAETGAAIVGIVPVDTVKQVTRAQTNKARIRATLPREKLVLAQTPQVFRYDLLVRAFAAAQSDGFIGTDESSLVERLEVEVSVVLGSDRNIKITKPSDMDLARLFLEEETAPPANCERIPHRTGLGCTPACAPPPADPGRRRHPLRTSDWKATPTPTCWPTPSPTPSWARPPWAISACIFPIPIPAGRAPAA